MHLRSTGRFLQIYLSLLVKNFPFSDWNILYFSPAQTMNDEKLCLKRNDFQESLQRSFAELQHDPDFTDVTLACEGESIEAHRVILSASSPLFKKLLKAHPQRQPLIFMRGLRKSELSAMVDLIYLGEANILQENLESFLALAREMGLEGFGESAPEHFSNTTFLDRGMENMADLSSVQMQYISPNPNQCLTDTKKNLGPKIEKIEKGEIVSKEQIMRSKVQVKQIPRLDPATIAVIESMFEKKEGGLACNHCEYTTKRKDHMKEHVEKHIGGLEYPCNNCDKILRSSNALRHHQRVCKSENIN